MNVISLLSMVLIQYNFVFYIEQIRLIKQLFPSYEILAVH
jgi:hypothetical protein